MGLLDIFKGKESEALEMSVQILMRDFIRELIRQYEEYDNNGYVKLDFITMTGETKGFSKTTTANMLQRMEDRGELESDSLCTEYRNGNYKFVKRYRFRGEYPEAEEGSEYTFIEG